MDGMSVGDLEGAWVGPGVGSFVGVLEANSVGTPVAGSTVGRFVGLNVGNFVGPSVGLRVAAVGAKVGLDEGCGVVRVALGAFVGRFVVGPTTGAADGRDVGLCDGRVVVVGADEGLGLGAFVGSNPFADTKAIFTYGVVNFSSCMIGALPKASAM